MSANWKALVGGCVIGALCAGLLQAGFISAEVDPTAATGLPEPTVVAVAAEQQMLDGYRHHWHVFRLWSDGSVDMTIARQVASGDCPIESSCIVQVVGPSCAGDVDHDGLVGIDDLVGVINTWGDCPEEPAADS